MNKPVKPNITVPSEFAKNGQKADFTQQKILNGFNMLEPDVLPGDNLNKFIDDTYKASNYALNLGDYTLGHNQITNCILEAPNGVATLSVSGSSVTVHSGLKVLLRNGRNADETLKSIEYTLPTDIVSNTLVNINTLTERRKIYVGENQAWLVGYKNEYIQENEPAINAFIQVWINPTTNKTYLSSTNNGAWVETPLACIGESANEYNTITSVTPFAPVDLLKRSDFSELSGLGLPSDNYINLTLGASGTVYTAPANGWYECIIDVQANGYLQMEDFFFQAANVNGYIGGLFPARKGKTMVIRYSNFINTIAFRFQHAQGEI